MNWKEIEKNCPLAYEMFIGEPADETWIANAYSREPTHTMMDGFEFHQRMLFDFFDENKIFIDIDHEFGEDWTFCIDQRGTGHSGDEECFDSREKAEARAFIEAFKILNNKLLKE